MSDEAYALATQDVRDPKRLIELFFSGSAKSCAKAVKFLGRVTGRNSPRPPPTELRAEDLPRLRTRLARPVLELFADHVESFLNRG
jgi:hypothetical protein